MALSSSLLAWFNFGYSTVLKKGFNMPKTINGKSNGVAEAAKIVASKPAPSVITVKTTPAAAEPTKEVTLEIPAMKLELVRLRVVGESPLIMHQWSEKAKAQMRDKQQKAAKVGREVRNPQAEFDAATYFISQNPVRYGFPVTAFKSSMVDAALAAGGKKTETRRAFHIQYDAVVNGNMLVEIHAPHRIMREDMVSVGMGTDLRYRPEFPTWEVHLTFQYDARQTSPAQLIALCNQSGFSTGVGEWRPEKDGLYGRFVVAGIMEFD